MSSRFPTLNKYLHPEAIEAMADASYVYTDYSEGACRNPRTMSGRCALGIALDVMGLDPFGEHKTPTPVPAAKLLMALPLFDTTTHLGSFWPELAELAEEIRVFIVDFDRGELLGATLQEALS